MARSNLGAALLQQNKPEQALDVLRKAIEMQPKYAAAHTNFGAALTHLGKVEEAGAAFRTAIGLDPQDANAYNNLGWVLSEQNKHEQAVVNIRKAIELDPKNATFCNHLGDVLQRQGKTREAVEAYSKVVELDPKTALRFLSRAWAYVALGQWDKAAADYERSVELDPTNHEAWRFTAYAHLAACNTDGYRRACAGLIERFGKTDDPFIAERTAKTCSAAPGAVADFGRVERLAERAVTGTEKHGLYRFLVLAKGLTEDRAGRHAQAVTWLKRFPHVPGEIQFDAIAFAALALAQHRLGRTDDAQASLAKAKAILAENMPDPSKGRPFTGNWHDWVHAQVLTREAEQSLVK